jgi:hypothetical protein
MQKVLPVEEAKSLMREAIDWSLWGWLTEKRRLRTTADRAWEALDDVEKKVKAGWSEDLQLAYRELQAKGRKNGHTRDVPQEVKSALQKLKEAEDEAHALRMQAEETFDQADRRMSIPMACQGAKEAIEAWEMRERVIRKAEALGRKEFRS